MLVRRCLVLIAFLLLLMGIGVAVRNSPSLQWIVDNEQQLRDRVESAPLRSWCAGVAIYVLLSLIPGTGGKSVIAGWLFGFWAAVAMVEIGLTTAAVISFLVGRYVVRELLRRRWRARLQVLSRHFTREGAFYLLLLRLAHAPFTLVNYGAGATKVPLTTFWWTTHLGILPGTAVFTFVGTRIPTLQIVVDQGLWSLIDLPLLTALAATAVTPFFLRPLHRRLARRFHHSRRHKTDDAQNESQSIEIEKHA